MSHDLPTLLLSLMHEIDQDIDLFRLDRAYSTAGGPFLSVASRLGWPQADQALTYVLAVRRVATLNRGPDAGQQDWTETLTAYQQTRETTSLWLAGKPLPAPSVSSPRPH